MIRHFGSKGYIKGLLWLAILAVIVFVGISFGKPYYRYFTLSSHTKDILMMEIRDIKRIRKMVLEDAANLQVPLYEQDLKISKTMKVIKVHAEWTDVVDFWGYYQKDLDFQMDVDY
jgi:hypothetical protein